MSPLLVLGMGRDFRLLGAWADAPWVGWLMLALALPVLAYTGAPHLRGASHALRASAANVDGAVILIASERWLRNNAVETARLAGIASDLSSGTVSERTVSSGTVSERTVSERTGIQVLPGATLAVPQTLVWVARDGILMGLLALADALRPEAPAAVAALRRAGLRVVVLTGDHREVAVAIAAQAGIAAEDVMAEVLPGDKAAAIATLQARGLVGMVGDGINDAPALARAAVGIAVGSGADVAIHAADVTLMRSDLGGLAEALALSRRTVAVIRQNLVWASIYNLVLIPVAAGVLYPIAAAPAALRALHPALAAVAMALSSLTVVLNSLRLRRLAGPRAGA